MKVAEQSSGESETYQPCERQSTLTGKLGQRDREQFLLPTSNLLTGVLSSASMPERANPGTTE